MEGVDYLATKSKMQVNPIQAITTTDKDLSSR